MNNCKGKFVPDPGTFYFNNEFINTISIKTRNIRNLVLFIKYLRI